MTLEVLTGDFKGDTGAVDIVLAAGPDVFAHNLETVPRLSRQVRVQASYARSYAILAHARKHAARSPRPASCSASARSSTRCATVLRELRALGVDILTLGQYLRPSHSTTCRSRASCTPDEFAALKDEALALGFPHVESGPLVRSLPRRRPGRARRRDCREEPRRRLIGHVVVGGASSRCCVPAGCSGVTVQPVVLPMASTIALTSATRHMMPVLPSRCRV